MSDSHSKTGVFLQRSSGEYVVMWQGREICRYASIEAFVDQHIKGLQAMDDNQQELLESYYKSFE